MAAQFNHTIVLCSDKEVSANFLADILGLPAPESVGPFLAVETANGVSLDFCNADGGIPVQHYAFLVDETEFDEMFERIRDRDLDYWADPMRTRPGEIGERADGRGVYFPDPDGHFLEIFTSSSASG